MSGDISKGSLELSLGLRGEAFHLGMTRVAGPRETWLGHVSGHTFNNSTARCGDNRAFFATLKETVEQNTHPFLRLDAFPVAKGCLLVDDPNIKCANLFAKAHEEASLL